jgi:hypothetical protein
LGIASPVGDHLKLAARFNTLYQPSDILGVGGYQWPPDMRYYFSYFFTSSGHG